MNVENQQYILKRTNIKKLIISQFIVLLAGTLFAWTNFVIEFIAWQNNKPCKTGCSVNLGQEFPIVQNQSLINPFLTPCFYGAIFFTIAFILSAIIVKKHSKQI